MNPSHCLRWYRTQKLLLHINPFSSLASCRHTVIIPNKNVKIDLYDKKLQIIHSRGARYGRRYPIKVIEHDKNKKYLDEYVTESKRQTAAPLVTDDYETDFSNDTQYEIVRQPQKKDRTKRTQQSGDQFIPNSDHRDKDMPKSYPKHKDIQQKPYKKKKNHKASDEHSESESDSEDEKVFKELNIQQYSKAHGKIKSYLIQGKSAHFREKNNFFCVEGWRLLTEGLNVGLKPLAIFFSRSRLFYNLIPTVAKTKEEVTDMLNMFPLYKTSYSEFKTWSSLTTPPGLMAVFPLSKTLELSKQAAKKTKSFPLTVILDQIRDPSNLGSIIRTLVAAGVAKIILTKGCCNLWDIKVLRSTCGAHFHMHCFSNVLWSEMETYLPTSPSVYLANACEIKREQEEEEPDAGEEEYFPSPTKTFNHIREIGLTESELNTSYKVSEGGKKYRVNSSFNNEEHLELFSYIDFPQFYYDQVNYFDQKTETGNESSVLVIGGETGLSKCAKKFALEAGGVQVGVPMTNNIDSLNSSVAVGILVYEAKKQYRQMEQESNVSSVET